MLEYGLTPKDKEQFEEPKNLYTGFGRGARDYVHIYVYTPEDEFVKGKMAAMQRDQELGISID